MGGPTKVLGRDADRVEWLELRRLGLGGSDIPAILGLSRWATPLSVFQDKLGLRDLDEEQSEMQKWGHLLEPVILHEFGQETGRKVRLSGELLQSTDIPWAMCTLDGEQCMEADWDANVQIKCYGAYGTGKWDEVPADVYAQVQWEMIVTQRTHSSAVCLQNGNRMVWADVKYDAEYCESVVFPAADTFWHEHVMKQEPPDPTGMAIDRAATLALHPADDGEVVPLPPEFVAIDDDMERLKREIRERQEELDRLKNKTFLAIGDASYGELPNGVRYTAKYLEIEEHVRKASRFRKLTRAAAKR